jgi:diacylglycerol kinase (ATP)
MNHQPLGQQPPPNPAVSPPVNPQKNRRGLTRLWHASLYSLAGLKAAWAGTPAFRLEVLLFACMLPAAGYIGKNWVEVTLLLSTGVLLMVVELLNTAIETAIDRIGLEHHALSGMAKDLGSAAVFIASGYTGLVWLAAALLHFMQKQ